MRPVLPAVLMLAAISLPGQPNRLTPEEKAAGWKLLFDGSTMNGWRDPLRLPPPGDAWKIEDGCLAAQPNPRIVEDLVSTEEFRDFELSFEWRISPGGNSGVKYRIQDLVMLRDPPAPPPMKFEDLVQLSITNRRTDRPARGQEYVVGFEYQIIDNRTSSDARFGPIRATASLYELVPVGKDATRPVGEFNQSRLIVKGLHAEHWLNGEKVLETGLDAPEIRKGLAQRWGSRSAVYRLLTEQPRRECPISLQNHTFPAWFRNIRIRRLN